MNNIFKIRLKRIMGEKAWASLHRIRAKLIETPIRDELEGRYYYNILKWNPIFRHRLVYYNNFEENNKKDLGIQAQSKESAYKNVAKRTKPHVLFVTEKWCDCNPERGPTNSEHNLFGSLEASGLATHNRFHFDEYYRLHNRASDAALLALCMESKPDLLFFTWAGNQYSPKWTTLKLIKRKMNIPVVAVWFEVMDLAESALPFVNLNIVMHSTSLQRTAYPEKNLLMWTPQDTRIYYNPNMNRDIDISFVGSMTTPHYAERRAGIAALRSNGIEVYQSGGQREESLSIEEYASIHMRSKIAINFGVGPNGIPHSKGRIFEATFCGAMLLDSESSETNIWFEPLVDYVPFANEHDLVEKARYYLAHDVEREQIASNGHQKAKQKYNAEAFWRAIFARTL